MLPTSPTNAPRQIVTAKSDAELAGFLADLRPPYAVHGHLILDVDGRPVAHVTPTHNPYQITAVLNAAHRLRALCLEAVARAEKGAQLRAEQRDRPELLRWDPDDAELQRLCETDHQDGGQINGETVGGEGGARDAA